jgi:hypothetical protein
MRGQLNFRPGVSRGWTHSVSCWSSSFSLLSADKLKLELYNKPEICFAHRQDNVLSFQRLNNLTIINYAIA